MITGELDQIREGGRLCAASDRRGSRTEWLAGGRRGAVRGVSESGHSQNGCRVRKYRQIRGLRVSIHNREISPKETLKSVA
jgi:hypothetical protein